MRCRSRKSTSESEIFQLISMQLSLASLLIASKSVL